jgi:hypothetical protein
MCMHKRRCPDARAPDRTAARVVANHPEQGWSLLCNGIVLFDDEGALLPDGNIYLPRTVSASAQQEGGQAVMGATAGDRHAGTWNMCVCYSGRRNSSLLGCLSRLSESSKATMSVRVGGKPSFLASGDPGAATDGVLNVPSRRF